MVYLHGGAETFDFEYLLSVGMSNQNTPDKTSLVVSDSDPVEIPVLLRIPTADGSPNYRDIYELPQEVLHEIARKCEAEGMCVEGGKTRYINYRKLNRNPEKYTPDKFGGTSFCVRDHLARQFSGRASPDEESTRPNQEFGLGGEQAQSADDKCCQGCIPCMHVFQREENEFALCLLPLPPKLRGNAEWNELAYWLWEKGK